MVKVLKVIHWYGSGRMKKAEALANKASFVTSREAAWMLGVSLRTVQLWVEGGVLAAWKTAGGHRRVALTSINAVLERRKQEVAGEVPEDRPFTVLIVEDSPETRKLYQHYIKSWGMPLKLVMASNGFEGLMEIGSSKPDLIISDLIMPGMDGFHMIRSLTNNIELQDMQIVVITGLQELDIEARGGLPAGVPVFYKPVPFDQLEVLLREKFATRHSANA